MSSKIIVVDVASAVMAIAGFYAMTYYNDGGIVGAACLLGAAFGVSFLLTCNPVIDILPPYQPYQP